MVGAGNNPHLAEKHSRSPGKHPGQLAEDRHRHLVGWVLHPPCGGLVAGSFRSTAHGPHSTELVVAFDWQWLVAHATSLEVADRYGQWLAWDGRFVSEPQFH